MPSEQQLNVEAYIWTYILLARYMALGFAVMDVLLKRLIFSMDA
jgi:hypothetical protein